MTATPTRLQRALMARAAVLFFLALVTGIWAGVVLTQGKALMLHLGPVKHERLALAAHLNGILGCFWILAVALTLEHTRFGPRGKAALAWLVTVVNYANWAITLIASFLDVRGLVFGEGPANDGVAALLLAFVVLPALATSALWAWGLLGSRADECPAS